MDNTHHFRNILYVNLLKRLAFFNKPPTPSARATRLASVSAGVIVNAICPFCLCCYAINGIPFNFIRKILSPTHKCYNLCKGIQSRSLIRRLMNSNFNAANQAIQNAQEALRKGDKRIVRRWAELAASLAPELEEPWLILAVVASPRASVAYLEQALKINPQSGRARAGMVWARDRLQRGSEKAAKPQPRVSPSFALPGKAMARRYSPLSILLLALAIVVVAWVVWPGIVSPALALIRSNGSLSAQADQHAWSGVDIAKPTYTPTATATSTPTPTPTQTETPTQTPTPVLISGEFIQPEVPSSSNEKLIVVDISEQHLYAYQGGVLVFSFIASTGIGNSTRIGSFSVLEKIPNAYGATWNIWMPNWLGIYWSGSLQNGIHALPILSGGARLWAGYLGRPISFGCVVLGVEEAQLLYDWADMGTPVVIQW